MAGRPTALEMRGPVGDAAAVRSSASLRSIAVVGSITAAIVGACSESRFPLGADCLRNEDCLSGICSQQRCTAAPPYLDSEAPATDSAALADAEDGEAAPSLDAPRSDVDAGPGLDAVADRPADAVGSSDGAADSPPETAVPDGSSMDVATDVRGGG
jgi:hypothetical protein